MATRLSDLAERKGILSKDEVRRVRTWIEEDRMSRDHSEEVIALLSRLVVTI